MAKATSLQALVDKSPKRSLGLKALTKEQLAEVEEILLRKLAGDEGASFQTIAESIKQHWGHVVSGSGLQLQAKRLQLRHATKKTR